jgi:hypothetical protein
MRGFVEPLHHPCHHQGSRSFIVVQQVTVAWWCLATGRLLPSPLVCRCFAWTTGGCGSGAPVPLHQQL